MGKRNVGAEVPSDLFVAHEGDDVHGHVVPAERKIVERLAVHVDHERVANLAGGFAGEVLQHPGGIDRDVTGWTPQNVEDGGRRRRDRPCHFHTVGKKDGVGHLNSS